MKRGRVCVVGSFMTDMTVEVDRQPYPGETVVGRSFQVHLGGKGFNQALAAARSGAETGMVGRIGADQSGRDFTAALRSAGVDTTGISIGESSQTGVGLPMVDAHGENSIVIVPLANSELSAADIKACAALIRSSDVLLLQLELPVETALEAARIASAAETKVFLNPAPAQQIGPELLELVDVLIPNETEAAQLAELAPAPADKTRNTITARNITDRPATSIDQSARGLMSRYACDLLITAGKDGAYLFGQGSPAEHLPSHQVIAVDTVGAGDTFCGALAARAAAGATLREAAEYAIAAAALAVTRKGSSSSPTASEVEAMLEGAVSQSTF